MFDSTTIKGFLLSAVSRAFYVFFYFYLLFMFQLFKLQVFFFHLCTNVWAYFVLQQQNFHCNKLFELYTFQKHIKNRVLKLKEITGATEAYFQFNCIKKARSSTNTEIRLPINISQFKSINLIYLCSF